MFFARKCALRLDTSSGRYSQRRKFFSILVLSAGALALYVCGGEGSGDAISSSVAAKAVNSGLAADAPTQPAGAVSNDPALVSKVDGGANSRIALQKAGIGD